MNFFGKKSETKKSELPSATLNEGGILISGGQLEDFEAAERFRMLRSYIDRQALKIDKITSLAITSAVPSEGKSVISVNLARSFSIDQTGKTILVDCDLRKPNVHRFFGKKPSPGVSDLIVSGNDLDAAITNADTHFDVLFAGSPVIDANRTIESDGFSLLIKELESRYRYVVLDCPPVLLCSEMLSISDVASATLLVTRAWRTEQALVKEASEMLQEHSLIGLVLNECSDSLSQYGYYGYYGYIGSSKNNSKSQKKKSFLGRLFSKS